MSAYKGTTELLPRLHIPIQEDQTDIAVSIDSNALNCLLLQASIGGGSRSPFTSKENLPHAVHP